jgi:predicted membrane protein (TIGR00267 family)
LGFLLRITGAQSIVRRYFVTNGFDGALTILGLLMGFYTAGEVSLPVTIGACLATAIALGVSGVSSAYISESAERQKELQELEKAMGAELADTSYGQAARLVPFIIALVNGLAPLAFSVVILTPLWLAQYQAPIPLDPVLAAIAVAFAIIFLLGVLLGWISGRFWLWMGLRTVLIALVTSALILLLNA